MLVKVRQIGRESPGVSADTLNDHSDGEEQIEFAKIAFLLQFTSTPGSTVKAAVPCNIWKLICIQEKPELLIISLPAVGTDDKFNRGHGGSAKRSRDFFQPHLCVLM